MEGMLTFAGIVMAVFGILQIILFFKIWGMTNDVSKIKDLLKTRLSAPSFKGVDNSITNENSMISPSKETGSANLPNDIKPGDNVIRLSDGKTMIVDSIEKGRYFCKGSFMEGYKYYRRDEIKILK